MENFPFILKKDEEIKQIKEHPDYYISNYGRIFSHKVRRKANNEWKIMTNRIKHDRYLYVFLSDNNKQYEYSVHRLVGKYFCPNYNENLVINHIDANPQNNYYKNLEWITTKENIQKSYITSKVNQFRNYKIYNIIYPDGRKSEDLIGISGIKKYVLDKKLNCSASSLQKYGYSKDFKIIRRNK